MNVSVSVCLSQVDVLSKRLDGCFGKEVSFRLFGTVL